MKLTILLFISLWAFMLKSQTNNALSYEGLYNGQVVVRKNHILNLQIILNDSIYFLYYWNESTKEKTEFKKLYIGTFSIDSKRILHLKGKHPFNTNDFAISDTISKTNEYELKMGYKQKREISIETRINKSLSTKRTHKIKLLKVLYKKSENQRYWENEGCCLPDFFYACKSKIFTDQVVEDSIFNNLKSKFETKCKLSTQKSHPFAYSKSSYSESRFFLVDSIRFDTVFVNKLLIEKRTDFQMQRDTLCLNATAKIQLNNFDKIPVYLPEHTKMFEQPDSESLFLYDRGETDRIKNVKILEYYKDWTGIEWIKLEIDVAIYNEDAENDSQERYISKQIVGWTLQKYLHVR